jgi:hypothetical protein
MLWEWSVTRGISLAMTGNNSCCAKQFSPALAFSSARSVSSYWLQWRIDLNMISRPIQLFGSGERWLLARNSKGTFTWNTHQLSCGCNAIETLCHIHLISPTEFGLFTSLVNLWHDFRKRNVKHILESYLLNFANFLQQKSKNTYFWR